jgi:hypothetical protein
MTAQLQRPTAPEQVVVIVGSRLERATAHATRQGAMGEQVLVCVNGHFSWIDSAKVRPAPPEQAGPPPTA